MKYIKRIARMFVTPVQFLIVMLIFMYGNLAGKFDNEPVVFDMHIYF